METDLDQLKINLPVEGMTCASCARRVESGLNDLDGVEASVNFATEQAAVRYDPRLASPQRLVEQVRSLGYDATLPSGGDAGGPPTHAHGHEHEHEHGEGHAHAHDAGPSAGRRLVVAVALGLPVLAMSMVPALRFDGWEWLAMVLSAPVLAWSAWPIHRMALRGARHRAANMDTLISVGTIAAWGWSFVVVVLLGSGHVYFEVASVVIAFVLLGRWLEARAKRSAGAALRALVELGAKDAIVVDDDGVERAVAIDQLQVGTTASPPPYRTPPTR